jgi:hypothetical protein
MITMTAVGLGLIFVLAGVVGVFDSMRAARWRQVAAERRECWAARQCVSVGAARKAGEPAAAGRMQSTAAR